MSADFGEIRRLLLAAAKMPASERESFLQNECGDDLEKLAEVKQLLSYEQDDPTILATGALNQATVSLQDSDAVENNLEKPEIDRIGPYQIGKVLGAGGMGVVYLAHQQKPIRRDVALKVLPRGKESAAVLSRFESERQALALMDHPHIAKIYDAGTDDTGRSYFVMELVAGMALTDYATGQKLSVSACMKLMVLVCRAVQHAHQKGIIHRDLKPSNILVFTQDNLPTPKVIDFGIAKAIRDVESLAQGVTLEGLLIGTPRYMSPEQARGDSHIADTRSDVYSLGVIAYELITGQSPYGDPASSVLGQVKQVCETEPLPFSQIAERELKLDQDWEVIIQKALAKDPDDRYVSVAALGDDLDRALHSQPILARAPSAVYLLKKFVVRNKIQSALASILAVSLVGFGIGMSVLYTRSEANLGRATTAEVESNQVSQMMIEMFEINDPGESRGNTITARGILDKADEKIDNDLSDQPEIQARMTYTLGSVYRGLGLLNKAEELLGKAWQIRRSVRATADFSELDADIMNDLGSIYLSSGESVAADSCYSEALEIKKGLFGPESEKYAVALSNLGSARLAMQDPEGAEEMMILANELLSKSSQENFLYSANLSSLGEIYLAQARYEEAELCFQQSYEIRDKIFDDNHPNLANAANNLGVFLQMRGRYQDAEQYLEQAVSIWEVTLGPEHPDLAGALVNLSVNLKSQGKNEMALPILLRALEIQETVFGPDNLNVALTLNNLGRLYVELNQFQAAEEALAKALDIRRAELGEENAQVASTLNSMGELALLRAQFEEAEVLLERALVIRNSVNGAGSPQASRVLHNLGRLKIAENQTEEGFRLLELALKIRVDTLGPNHPRVAQSLSACAETLYAMGHNARADSMSLAATELNERLSN